MEDKSFIEVQFPVSKLSKECYKERKAGSGQTLPRFGKWWGRKPLILVRAILLGLLMPSTENSTEDAEIFLKALMMDDESLWKRKNRYIPKKVLFEKMTPSEQNQYFEVNSDYEFKKNIDKSFLQRLIFNRLSYDEKLKYCVRLEHIPNLEPEVWEELNNYLGIHALSFSELFRQLGEKRFHRKLTIGDCFCGGGSIPFEAARMGFETYASDLNPIATFLTKASIDLVGGKIEETNEIKSFLSRVFRLAQTQYKMWGIERNEKGWEANSYLYCYETVCPECGYRIPLSRTWIIGSKTKTVALLKRNDSSKSFEIEIVSDAVSGMMEEAEQWVTLTDDYSLKCPNTDCRKETPIPSIRKDVDDKQKRPYRYNLPNSLRKWGKADFIHREDDIFRERLYCIRYEDVSGNRYYIAPTEQDRKREEKVNTLLRERFLPWQENGYIPSTQIENGWNTNQLIFEKGWTHWSHLYNPRQLLMTGLLGKIVYEQAHNLEEKTIGLLAINKCVNWNSRLSIWHTDDTHNSEQLFYNQAFNTLFNYACRGLVALKEIWEIDFKSEAFEEKSVVEPKDARNINTISDIWITDPPYADSVNYHELTELFLAWDKRILKEIFPGGYVDTKRALAVQGTGKTFDESMIEIYSNLEKHMPEDGFQVVMFTHNKPEVWAELTMILWSAGLQVISAWTIATETEAGGLHDGNYVTGTVVMVLKKQTNHLVAFRDDIYPRIKTEVKRQINEMRKIDSGDDPNFTDPDYILTAYVSALKILTSYSKIEGINLQYELSKEDKSDSPIVDIINKAKSIAYDYLIPTDFNKLLWKNLNAPERFYLKGLELEIGKNYQLGAYQELAQGYGVNNYKNFLFSTKANRARLKSPFEIKNGNTNNQFSNSLVRKILYALYASFRDENPLQGRNYLKTERPNYWKERQDIIQVLEFFARLRFIVHMSQWKEVGEVAFILKESIKNDGV